MAEYKDNMGDLSVVSDVARLNNDDGSLTVFGEQTVINAFHALAVDSMTNAEAKGWYDDEAKQRSFGEEIGLFHSEVSEAMEEWRNNRGFSEIYFKDSQTGEETSHPSTLAFRDHDAEATTPMKAVLNKPEGIAAELGDAVIRFADSSGKRNIPLGLAIVLKLRFNRTRSYRHGGKQA